MCVSCVLASTRKNIVWGKGDPTSCRIMFVGEAPGEKEDLSGLPFVGKAGVERDNYLRRNRIADVPYYTTNIVKCRPPGNRDPKPAEIAACRDYLEAELALLHPDAIIVTLGRFATRWFLGEDADPELLHGIPQYAYDHTILPAYHPAAGLHNTSMMTQIGFDFRQLGELIRGTLETPVDLLDPDYRLLDDTSIPRDGNRIVAVDTESDGATPFSLQLSMKPGTGRTVMANSLGIQHAKDIIEDPSNLVVFHFAQHDLPVLREMGIHPTRWTDTFLMANLLQNVPRGLKALAYRLCGMKMQDYSDLVGPYTQGKAISYLQEVAKYEWPIPDPVMERTPKGDYKIRQPQSMNRKVRDILNKGNSDLYKWWTKTEGTEIVEQELGPMTPASVADIPFEDFLFYATRDPDATLRVYYLLQERIRQEGLQEVLERDIREVPYVIRIEQSGAPVDPPYFEALGEEMQEKCYEVENRIQSKIGYWINPDSDDQVAKLLFTRLGLKPIKRTKSGGNSTDNSVLERLKGQHPIIEDIIEYRTLSHTKSAYCDVITREEREGRIYSHWSMGTVETGRLACRDPINLMGIPVRTALGRRVRDGFEARPGCVLLSADYSQIEMRVVADDSQDEVMMSIFQRGDDIHSATASTMFHLPTNQLDEMEHRYPAKRTGFGILNYISASGLLREMEVGGAKGWTERKCQDLIDSWFQIYSGVRAYMESKRVEARRNQEVRDRFGRKRLIPEVLSAHAWIREAGLRQAANAPIQMGAQGIIKQAMGDLDPIIEEFNQQGSIVTPWAQIHDDLPFELEEDILPIFAPILVHTMENAVTLSVPIKVDLKVGKKWGSMEKYKL